MKILYGVDSHYVNIVKPDLFKEGIPLVGYQPGSRFGRFIITYPDGRQKTIAETAELHRNCILFNKMTDWGAVVNELRMTAMEGGL